MPLPAPGTTPVLELDELWSFVRSKEEPAWIWVALDRETRQVVACCLGDRSEESCRYLWEQVPAPWRTATCYTDFWGAYQAVIPAAQHVAAGKERGKRRMSSARTTRCARGWGSLYAKPCRFPNPTRCMMHD